MSVLVIPELLIATVLPRRTGTIVQLQEIEIRPDVLLAALMIAVEELRHQATVATAEVGLPLAIAVVLVLLAAAALDQAAVVVHHAA